MQGRDIPRNPASRTLRQFAAGWLLFFLALAAWQAFHHAHPKQGVALAVLAIVGGVAGLVKPSALRWLFRGWLILAFPIGWLISLAVLFVVFFGVFTPLALLFRWRGRDALRLRRPANSEGGLWQPREAPLDRRSYLRQY
jgi:hypothetical protein